MRTTIFFVVTLLFLSTSALRQSELAAIVPKIDNLFKTFKPPSGWFLPATVLRLAFHDAGTYSVNAGNGGPHGVQYFNCVRGQQICEQNNPDNSGLAWAIDALEKVYKEHKFQLSRADFWQLAAIQAIKFTGGPSLLFRWGRVDYTAEWSQLSRLPGSQGDISHLRSTMGANLGLTDRDIVALMGGHTLGSMHSLASGHLFPWDDTEKKFDNQYYVSLMKNDWSWTNSNSGQFQARRNGKTLAMLNTDMALKRTIGKLNQPSAVAGIVQEFADSEDAFFAAFASAWDKVTSNGAKNLRVVCDDDDPTCFWLPPALPPKPTFKVSPPPRGGYYSPKPRPITYYSPAPTPRTGYVPPASFPVPKPIPVPKPVPVPQPIPVAPKPVPVAPKPAPVPFAIPVAIPVPPKPVPQPVASVPEPLPLTGGVVPQPSNNVPLPIPEDVPVPPQPVIAPVPISLPQEIPVAQQPIPIAVVEAPIPDSNIVDDLPPLEGLRTEGEDSGSGGTPGWVWGVVAAGVVVALAVIVLSILAYKRLRRPMETV